MTPHRDARVTSDPVIAALRRQAMIVEHLYDGVIVTDPEGIILDWNPAAERMFGYTKPEVIGRKAEMLNRPGEGSAISAAIQAAMAADGYWTGELTAVAKDGSERAVEASVIALRDTRGRQIGRFAVNRDITEQRRAERVQSAAFLISEAAATTQSLPELFQALHEILGRLMPARNFYVALYDPATDLITYPYHVDEHDVLPAPHRPGRGLTDLVLKRGERLLVTPERPGPEADGTVELVGVRSLDWLGVPLKIGGRTIGMFAVQSYSRQVRYGEHEAQILQLVASQVATAIERRRLESERRGEQEFLRQVIDLNPSLIFVKDRQGRFTLVNRSLAELYGAPADNLIGRTDGDFNKNPEEVAQYRRDDEEAIATGRPKLILEESNTDAQTGRQRWFQVIKVPLTSADGAPHVLGVATEITQRKELEHQLRQSQKMEAVGQLAGGIAHDFNNVLTAILGYTRLLLKESGLAPQQRDDVTEIEEAAERAASLTRQLLAFSRKQIMQPTVLNVNEVVQGMRSLLRRLIGEHIALVAAFDSEPVFVRADQGQLQQVVVNLSVNARDAMPAGGTLMLATARVELDAAFVAAHPGSTVGPHVRLIVSDNGMGMDSEVRRRVFEPFFTTKPVGKGSGLGLATVYGIVKQSGGYIDVESQPGQGSTFTIYLPRVAAPTAPVAETPIPAPRPGRETVLLVEDEAAVRALARRALKQFGYHVLEASNGVEALTVARASADPIDLLLTDVVMPEMGGRELAQTLKQERPETRVLFTSGYPDSGGMALDVAESGVPYLPKPYTPNELAEKVREVLDTPVTS